MTIGEIYDNMKDFVKSKSAIILLAGVIGFGSTFYFSNKYETHRENIFPLAFSERTALRKEAELNGGKLGPATDYLTTVSDSGFKILEAWNYARNIDGNNDDGQRFVRELEAKDMDGHTDKLSSLLKSIPQKGDNLMNELTSYKDSSIIAKNVEGDFNKAWKEDHDDIYYPVTVNDYDSKGNLVGSHIEMRYDHTDHSYWYNRENGESASKSIDSLVTNFNGKIHFDEKLPIVRKTQAEGEYAADKTIKHKDDRHRFTQEEYNEIANQWNFGSITSILIPKLDGLWKEIVSGGDLWRINFQNPLSDYKYSTHSRSDAGPIYYQMTKGIEGNCSDYCGTTEKLFNAINIAQKNSQEILQLIPQLEKIVFSHAKGDRKQIEREILNRVVENYKTNFPGSKIDIDQQKRLWLTILLSLLGGAVGAGIAAGGFSLKERFGQNA